MWAVVDVATTFSGVKGAQLAGKGFCKSAGSIVQKGIKLARLEKVVDTVKAVVKLCKVAQVEQSLWDKLFNGIEVSANTCSEVSKVIRKLTNKEAAKIATDNGYRLVKGNQIPKGLKSHGSTVYKKGNKYISPDNTVHGHGEKVTYWKEFDSKGKRIASLDENLNRVRK